MGTESNPTPDIPAGSAEIPAADLPAEALQPDTQGTDPLAAELGEDGQGDLAPEDIAPQDFDDPENPATPEDLRTELPNDHI